jgi:hypothetical protein
MDTEGSCWTCDMYRILEAWECDMGKYHQRSRLEGIFSEA